MLTFLIKYLYRFSYIRQEAKDIGNLNLVYRILALALDPVTVLNASYCSDRKRVP